MPAQPTYEQLEKRMRDLEKTEPEHQKAIKELRRSREMLARTEQIAHSGSWEWDIAADEVTWSEGLRRIFQIDAAARAPTWAEQQALHPPEDWQAFCESLAKAVEETKPYELELRALRKDGQTRICVARGHPETGPDGKVARIYGSLQDITASRNSEEELRESERQLATLMRNLPGMAYRCSNKTGWPMEYVSEGCLALTGYTPDALTSPGYPHYGDLIHPEDRAGVWGSVQKGVDQGEPFVLEYRIRDKQGQERWVWEQGRVVGKDSSESAVLEGFISDVTARKEAEEALRESEGKYRSILESMEDGYFEVDLTGNFTFFNDALCNIFGYSSDDLMGMNNRQYLSAENAKKVFDAFNRVYRTGRSYKAFNLELIRKDGSKRQVDTSVSLIQDAKGEPKGFRGTARDVTERKQAEQEKEKLNAQLRHAQQMEAIGTLAGGIAHDFNNILFSVIGYTELSLEETKKDTQLHKNLSEVLKGANRARDLVRQILTLSRYNEQQKKPFALTAIVKEALKMLRSTIPASIDFQENICSEQLIVRGDPTQIHQVIINLVTNAAHAMTEMEGLLEFCVQPASLDQRISEKYPDIAPGDYAEITVSDTGVGMDEQALNKIFEPYFTTKDQGEGTGLGLSVVHGIVKSHGGCIVVSSEPGRGSTFHVYLPLDARQDAQMAAQSTELPPTGNENILLTDDELPIAEMQQQSLERLGYNVTVHTDSRQALDAFRAAPEAFDLIVTDM
ncbi:MAG TPA: PAS domain S-box protein, partial [Desulfosalsimonadaceae bacterium]|nr:PAS domain S-box protein [Desulfosalsimonadaceae bacterium]